MVIALKDVIQSIQKEKNQKASKSMTQMKMFIQTMPYSILRETIVYLSIFLNPLKGGKLQNSYTTLNATNYNIFHKRKL